MRVLVILWALVALHGALLLWAGILGRGPEGWGLHSWGYLTTPSLALLILGAGAAGAAVLRAWPFPRRPRALVILAVLAATFFFLFRDRTHLLGDGQLWISVLRKTPVFHSNEPLAFAFPWLVSRGAFDVGAFVLRLELWSVVLGVTAVFLAALIAHRVTSHSGGRWFAFLLITSLGSIQFAFGYVEAYPAFWVAVLFYLWIALRTLESGRGWALLGLALGLAVAVHSMGVLLIVPTLLFFRLKPRGKDLGAAVGGAALMVAVAYGVLPYLMPSAARDAAGLQDVMAGSSRLLSGMRMYPHGLTEWSLDQLNRWSLLAPLCLEWIGLGLLRKRFMNEPDDTDTRGPGHLVIPFLGITAMVFVLPALILDTEGSRGASADWDAFAVAGVPLAVLAAFLWGPLLQGMTALRLPLAASIFLVVVTGYGFVFVNASETLAPRRMEALATSPVWSTNAKGLAYESLATHYRDRGDSTRAAEMYGKAIAFQGGNVRLLRNTAKMFSRTGRHRDAADTYQKLLARESTRAEDWVSYGAALELSGAPDSAAMALRYALTLDDTDVNAMNQLGRLLLTPPTGEAQVRQAYDLLRRSLTLAPDQAYAEGIRRTLARIEAQGIGPR